MKGFAAHHAPLGTRFGLRQQPEHRTERGRAEFLSWTLVEARGETGRAGRDRADAGRCRAGRGRPGPAAAGRCRVTLIHILRTCEAPRRARRPGSWPFPMSTAPGCPSDVSATQLSRTTRPPAGRSALPRGPGKRRAEAAPGPWQRRSPGYRSLNASHRSGLGAGEVADPLLERPQVRRWIGAPAFTRPLPALRGPGRRRVGGAGRDVPLRAQRRRGARP